MKENKPSKLRKVRKFFRTPGIFFRDYLNNKYPIQNTEVSVEEPLEQIIIKNNLAVAGLDSYSGKSPIIDVVFTWVNDKDPKWQKKLNSYKNKTDEKIGLHAQDDARFCDHNELYYSVLSVKRYLPWVRRIFIITDEQCPEWLDYQDDKIQIVDHKSLINEDYLPTFNSHVIEAHLHKIPELSENFIYFNDDVFVARNLPPQHFFRNNDIASLFLSNKKLSEMKKKGIMTPTLFASLNCIKLLEQKYRCQVNIPIIHTYIPLKKSYFEKAWRLYNREIKCFLVNKFRSSNDLNLATFLVPWLMYLDSKSVVAQDICYYFNIRSPHALQQYKKLLKHKEQGIMPNSFCANDFNSNNSFENYDIGLYKFLNKYYLENI